ncbi:Nitric oxide reductase activation protein [Variovorax sp. PBS-H4]|uniref:nitric oxide reductase activation protein NorD n=1 Tax=Variovorax sp. PBS-H4 TaxID=434008 RepID=UPI0013178ECC|nr:VWA domain-containing protein [Variovorax sp. PBS-H4]VTU41193.1 Nitric oxide reductase activation protein [Variovorax sp. PBS-H4]
MISTGTVDLPGVVDRALGSSHPSAGEGPRKQLLSWLHALHEDDQACAAALAGKLEWLLARAPVEALGRWIVTGLRLHAGDRARLRAYLALADARAIESLDREIAEGGARHVATSIAWLLEGLTERPITIQARDRDDLYAAPLRPTLTPTHLLLPNDYTALDGADRYRLYRTAAAHAAAHLLHSTPARPAGKLKPMSLAVISAIEDARVERLLLRDYPGMRRWFADALAHALQPGALSFAALISRMNLALIDPHYQDDNYWVNKSRTLFESQALLGLDDYAAFRHIGSVLANDLGQMRVPFRAELYRVPAAYRDDNSFLWASDGERAQTREIELEQPPAIPQGPRPTERSDADPRPEASATHEVELGRHAYPEWDDRVAVMRSNWCTVIDKLPSWRTVRRDLGSPSIPGAGQALRLVRAHRFSRAHRLRRQWEGDDLDLNAAIEVMVAQRARMATDPRLFIRSAHQERTSSVLVLLDLSESTNDRLHAAGPSLLDIEKQAALLLARAVAHGPDRIAIHGFSTNTRAEVSNYRLLEFGSPLDDVAESMIACAPARHSTRMGAALRHAVRAFAGEPSGNRIVLLVTDGAPSDVDVHEPGYLVEDARAAVHEAREEGIHVHGLAVDPQGHAYVRRIFGWGHFDIVDDPRALPARLCRLYARLSAA